MYLQTKKMGFAFFLRIIPNNCNREYFHCNRLRLHCDFVHS